MHAWCLIILDVFHCIIKHACLPDIGVNELMTGAGQLFPSVMKLVLEHSCITSQLPPHHPHGNSSPIPTAMHSEHRLAKLRQSYSVTTCVCVCGGEIDTVKRMVHHRRRYIPSVSGTVLLLTSFPGHITMTTAGELPTPAEGSSYIYTE